MHIRQVETRDIPALMPLMLGYIVDFYQEAHPGVDRLDAFIRHLLENPEEGVQFVAEDDGVLAGFSTLYFIWSTLKIKRFVVMNDLFVAESYRGHHVGEILMKAVIHYAEERNLMPIQWETGHDNVVAQRLYQKMGGRISPTLHYELD